MLWVRHRKYVEKIRAITTQSLTVAASGQLKIVKETVPGAEPTKMFQDIMLLDVCFNSFYFYV